MDELTIAEWLEHPDPDVETLPAELPKDLELQEQQALRLARAIPRHEAHIERLRQAAEKDREAWQQLIGAAELRGQTLRIILKDWMLRKGVHKLASPWVTASLTKPRTRVVVDDEAGVIAACEALGASEAIQTVRRLVKKTFDTIWNAQPTWFKGVAHEEETEPGLQIRAKE